MREAYFTPTRRKEGRRRHFRRLIPPFARQRRLIYPSNLLGRRCSSVPAGACVRFQHPLTPIPAISPARAPGSSYGVYASAADDDYSFHVAWYRHRHKAGSSRFSFAVFSVAF